MRVRVVSYNILSPALCSKKCFPQCTADALDPSNRLNRVITKLKTETESLSVICMQEVCRDWYGPLTSFFSKQNYCMVISNYADSFSGFMGCAIAVPLSKYVLSDVKIYRVGQLLESYARPATSSLAGQTSLVSLFAEKIWRFAASWSHSLREALLDRFWRARAPFRSRSTGMTNFQAACARKNTTVMVKLREKAGQREAVFATYHMPCEFRRPPLMALHVTGLFRVVQQFAQRLPFAIAGDFNIKPIDTHLYGLAVGEADPPSDDAESAAVVRQLKNRVPLRSAYKEALSSEPEWTNWTKYAGCDEFKECLDYIFVSRDVEVESVEPLPKVQGPLPTVQEPSDHIPIAASLTMH